MFLAGKLKATWLKVFGIIAWKVVGPSMYRLLPSLPIMIILKFMGAVEAGFLALLRVNVFELLLAAGYSEENNTTS